VFNAVTHADRKTHRLMNTGIIDTDENNRADQDRFCSFSSISSNSSSSSYPSSNSLTLSPQYRNNLEIRLMWWWWCYSSYCCCWWWRYIYNWRSTVPTGQHPL